MAEGELWATVQRLQAEDLLPPKVGYSGGPFNGWSLGLLPLSDQHASMLIEAHLTAYLERVCGGFACTLVDGWYFMSCPSQAKGWFERELESVREWQRRVDLYGAKACGGVYALCHMSSISDWTARGQCKAELLLLVAKEVQKRVTP